MNKNLLFLLFGTLTVILSVAIIAVGPITNKIIGKNWGYQNCELISDQAKLLKDDITKLKKMKNLCYRQKAMHDMEYTSFIINIVLGFLCADLALIHYLGYGKEFEIKSGVIGLISGGIGFILALVYVCYSGYIFTNDVAFLELDIGFNQFNFNEGEAINKLYSNGARYKWEEFDDKVKYPNGGKYITEYENDRNDYSNLIRYKDLGKKQYNYNSKYYKSYNRYNEINEDENQCQYMNSQNLLIQKTSCDYLYGEPKYETTNKYLYDRWLAALILACLVLLCDLGLAFFGFMHCSNFGFSSNI